MSKLSRRETLARAGVAVAAAAVLPVAAKAALASEGEDSKLIALWRRYQERVAHTSRLNEEEDRLIESVAGTEAGRQRIEGLIRRSYDEANEIESQIAATPANTFAGLAIKLRIGTDNQPFRWDLNYRVEELSTDELNLMTALADAERLAGWAS